ncbi:MAG TPA: CheR family methyltransferase [Geminicoccus sp.]|jgi:two-component system CheB/CheR fusion protein|uniref:CheR family methyltransferase n=1 Tax=Geminicoccus sp. TaxID=2024832 RepID=UPI002E335FAC|nr:CheR family methyltransferase [Geminicoccus sp.]HEX2527225.1 CheR family methyltransferase [Geminicoccus sp.]
MLVAVAASAADPGPLEDFLEQLALSAGAAMVVILQHREALDEDAFLTRMAERGCILTRIENDMPVEQGKTYLSAPDVVSTIHDGRFQVRPSEQNPGERGTIDSFLVSLAQEENGHAIAVLFSSTGTDGTLGVTAIKASGGLIIAEETREYREDSLALSSTPAALADFIFPAEEMANRVAFHLKRLLRQQKEVAANASAADISNIATVLRNKTGHDFHGYKKGTFLRRVQRRMEVVQADTLPDYLEILRTQPDEPQLLFNDLLIGVTQFFRDPKEFELLDSLVIPKLLQGRSRNDQVRVWAVGCSTGEEAYSLAILLREHMAKLDVVPQVQIFATDLDGRALASARSGRYTNAISQQMSPERLRRWFVKEGNTFLVVRELREICVFSQHSLIKDAPFSRLDLVSCRNLLIYLDPELQNQVVPLFHFALKEGRYLFLGNSENVSRHAQLFVPIESRARIFQRQDTAGRVLPDLTFTPIDPRRPLESPSPLPKPRLRDGLLTRRAERLVERYAPAYVITDQMFSVLHFSAKMGRYIHPTGGAASLDLLSLIHPDLRVHLRLALNKAAESGETVHSSDLLMTIDGQLLQVDLVVEPVKDDAPSSRTFVVIFKEGPDPSEKARERVPDSDDERVQRLDAELLVARERLQATIEELESTNEELTSSNEEYQSLNEELQSANEELETSKEELQSVNEELSTVNGELAHRVQELARANSDLKNLLESTQIATIFLDNDLRVANYTPAVADIFHLIESDFGRPIGHIKSRVAYDNLQEDARRVLRTLASVEREIEAPQNGRSYLARVLPYRSVDNFIAGVVMTFVDITARRRAEEALRDREERFRLIVEGALDYAIVVTDRSGRIEEWSPGAAAVFGWTAQEATGQMLAILYTPEDRDQGTPEKEIAQAREEGMAPDVRWHMRKDGTRVFIEGSARALYDASGRFRGVMKIGQDVTERREREERLRQSESQAKLLLGELQHRVRNTLAVVRSIARRSAVNSKTVEDYAAHLDGRLNAFARVQAVTTRDPAAGLDLEMLVADELLAHAAREGEQVSVIKGPKVRLQPRTAETFGLALHELATNAVKYGALTSPKGRIEVSWRFEEREGGRYLVLDWIETGVQLDAAGPQRRGFGTELIERTLAYELGGETGLQFGSNGLRCTIRLPATEQIIVLSKAPSGTGHGP